MNQEFSVSRTGYTRLSVLGHFVIYTNVLSYTFLFVLANVHVYESVDSPEATYTYMINELISLSVITRSARNNSQISQWYIMQS